MQNVTLKQGPGHGQVLEVEDGVEVVSLDLPGEFPPPGDVATFEDCVVSFRATEYWRTGPAEFTHAESMPEEWMFGAEVWVSPFHDGQLTTEEVNRTLAYRFLRFLIKKIAGRVHWTHATDDLPCVLAQNSSARTSMVIMTTEEFNHVVRMIADAAKAGKPLPRAWPAEPGATITL